MRCPVCGRELTTDYDRPPTSCPCGWGVRRPVKHADEEGFEGSGPARGFMLVFLWFLTVAMTVGSYFLVGADEQWKAVSYWRPLFVAGWLVYILACFVFRQPSLDGVRLWWRFDNPFSVRDYTERQKIDLAIVMVPGKLICYTLYSTWTLIQGK